MSLRLFSDRMRPVHLGPYPLERLRRGPLPDLARLAPWPVPRFRREDDPCSIANAMAEFQAMLDAIRDGLVNRARATIPDDPRARAEHLKAFGHFSDAAMVGIGPVTPACLLPAPRRNPEIDRLAQALRTRQTKTLAAGIDVIMADLKDSMEAPPRGIGGHHTAIVFLTEWHRDPDPEEAGAGWLRDAQAERAALRSAETAVVLATYLRLLGHDACAHTATSTDVDLGRLAVAAGLACIEGDAAVAPWLGRRFGLAAVTTTLELAHDRPLAEREARPGLRSHGPAWWLGLGSAKSALNRDPFRRRPYALGPHPFEALKRRDTPTTFIDEPNVPRVPKRADLFARAQFGDLGRRVQDAAKGGHYARKAAPAGAQRRALGALVLLQDGPPAPARATLPPQDAAAHVKAAAYFLGLDAVGISRCPPWAWYSHDATGAPIDPPHDQAISMIVDQGYQTMSGASGDDWISVAQSMRAYLRFSLLGGVIAQQIRNLGYSARAHTVLDGEVLQPPLLLLSGLGEVSRIGEVILNPFLGPRLKSGVVTTDLPMAHDRPIDFGLQRFCESCNKCARECPSGAITAGPKRMFNGYEIWKSDSQKCATYRITTPGGSMCGRCMKTCPWNLEGLFAERPFRWAAMNLPAAAPILARLDDAAGRGGINPAKTWWWDLELQDDGGYRPTRAPVNRRGLQRRLKVRAEDQTMAVYPAPLAPPPWPWPAPLDREAGIAAFRALVSAEDYRRRLAAGDDSVVHRYAPPATAPILTARVAATRRLTPDILEVAFERPDGAPMPPWEAGAHVDVLVAPEYLRPYSLTGDPADTARWRIAVLREDAGRGGSKLLHRVFVPGRRVVLSHPANHFPLAEDATQSILCAGGIGVTPMIAFAHRLHRLGRPFVLHYSCGTRAAAAFAPELAAQPWADRVRLHLSDEGTRADFPSLLPDWAAGVHVYACGPTRHMEAVKAAATARGFPPEAVHAEYFAAPDTAHGPDHPFVLRLARSARDIAVGTDESAADALAAAGVPVDVKCADGLCGVCQCGLMGGAVDHRDHVLSAAQRETRIILCRSRAAEPGGIVEIDL